MQGQSQVVAALLKETDINVDKRDSEGRTALHHAAHKGETACVSLLIGNRAHVNAPDNSGGCALHPIGLVCRGYYN
jgi:ankyrin repeat protein